MARDDGRGSITHTLLAPFRLPPRLLKSISCSTKILGPFYLHACKLQLFPPSRLTTPRQMATLFSSAKLFQRQETAVKLGRMKHSKCIHKERFQKATVWCSTRFGPSEQKLSQSYEQKGRYLYFSSTWLYATRLRHWFFVRLNSSR